jgi:hypothetical protein
VRLLAINGVDLATQTRLDAASAAAAARSGAAEAAVVADEYPDTDAQYGKAGGAGADDATAGGGGGDGEDDGNSVCSLPGHPHLVPSTSAAGLIHIRPRTHPRTHPHLRRI